MQPKLKPAQIRIVSNYYTQHIEDKNETILNLDTSTARKVLREIGYEKIKEYTEDQTTIEIWELPLDRRLH